MGYRCVGARIGQRLDPAVAVHLLHGSGPGQMPIRTLVLAVVRVGVGVGVHWRLPITALI